MKTTGRGFLLTLCSLLIAFGGLVVVRAVAVQYGLTSGGRGPTPQEQWVRLRAAVPSATPLFRPAWLPAALQAASMGFDTASAARGTLYYVVTYGDRHDETSTPYLSLTFGSACAPCSATHARPDWVLPLHVGNLRQARILVRQSDPGITLVWQQGTFTYAMSAWGIHLGAVLRIAASLRPF